MRIILTRYNLDSRRCKDIASEAIRRVDAVQKIGMNTSSPSMKRNRLHISLIYCRTHPSLSYYCRAGNLPLADKERRFEAAVQQADLLYRECEYLLDTLLDLMKLRQVVVMPSLLSQAGIIILSSCEVIRRDSVEGLMFSSLHFPHIFRCPVCYAIHKLFDLRRTRSEPVKLSRYRQLLQS